ncbi:hypothetical protein FHW74_003624 [Atlantibacter sp. RC6]|nr:hypothetical protein [Atlantibacter sp. RC6]
MNIITPTYKRFICKLMFRLGSKLLLQFEFSIN